MYWKVYWKVGRSVDGRSPSSFSCSDGPMGHSVGRSVGRSVDGRSPSSFSCSDGPMGHRWVAACYSSYPTLLPLIG